MSIELARERGREDPPSDNPPLADDAPRYEGIDSALKELLATGVDEVGDVTSIGCNEQGFTRLGWPWP